MVSMTPEGKVLCPSTQSLLTTLILILREQGLVIDTDELYDRATASEQHLQDGLREHSLLPQDEMSCRRRSAAAKLSAEEYFSEVERQLGRKPKSWEAGESDQGS